eukprot:6176800-Prymnesium_polylepis.2
MYEGFADVPVAHALVANDVKAAAAALLRAGSVGRAAELFAYGARRFESFYDSTRLDCIDRPRATH